MKWLIAAFLLFCIPCWAANDLGFDFRASSGFVSDPSYANYVLDTDTYPTTRTINGVSVTFGWETPISSRDRNAGVDARLAGINFVSNAGTTSTFRVDLPATGQWKIGLALGDGASGNNQRTYCVVKDTATAVITFAPAISGGTSYVDASGAVWSTAAWPANNVLVTKTFATTILRVVLSGTVDTDSSTIAHMRLIQVAPVAARASQTFVF